MSPPVIVPKQARRAGSLGIGRDLEGSVCLLLKDEQNEVFAMVALGPAEAHRLIEGLYRELEATRATHPNAELN